MLRTLKAVRRLAAGDARGRWAAFRDGSAAMRVAMVGAGLRTGVLDGLRAGPVTGPDLAASLGYTDVDLLLAYLRVLEAAGLARRAGVAWELTGRGRRLLGDDLVRAAYEGKSSVHTGLYSGLGAQLAGGPGRTDIAERAELVARLSAGFDPFVDRFLTRLVRDVAPSRVVDLGCGAGGRLAVMLGAAPDAVGVGVEPDAAVAGAALATATRQGLAERARVEVADLADVVARGPASIGGAVDLALLADVVSYVPVRERVRLLAGCAGLLRSGGLLVVVTTAAERVFFSRHLDLLLRAQGSGMELPDVGELASQLVAAGLVPDRPRRLAPGQPLVAVVARRPVPQPTGHSAPARVGGRSALARDPRGGGRSEP